MYMGNEWDYHLAEEYAKEYFRELEKKLTIAYRDKEIMPTQANIFKAFKLTDFRNVKCIILGQDPYPKLGYACGLSFSVNRDKPIPKSLKNIFKELNSDLGLPQPSHGNLTHWAEQGVFLLNTVLTVEAGKSNSHRGIGWELFTDEVIRKLNEERDNLIFMLWGKSAQAKKVLIDESKHLVLETSHPSPHSVNLGFSGCEHFSKANQFLESVGISTIDWNVN